ncbi:His Kinase A (phospho-acceptor) domain-containing protein [Thermoactinomyces sp. DSM 45891]|uniref:sensor histidine kinase n=1 Tax=Thermoactinomyces sp. DSM 45891 TaxID=1761907 RepID=UPI00091246F9|nr:HAMP domain-containing sensor histidine kinase [Thermoactinomyces sp. DSM 45891]SFX31637.1 His Kinase A (phospho-acceptor) domain-containing protein [Thermoactinomyces sp. DSM 45891]
MRDKVYYRILSKIAAVFIFSLWASLFISNFVYSLLKEYTSNLEAIESLLPIRMEYILVGLFGIIIFLLFTARYIRYFIQICHAVSEIAQGDSKKRVPVKFQNEFSKLATRINLILEQLRTAVEEERLAEQTKNELITNVSHDLRTPLTSIMGYLSLIDRNQYQDEVELRYYTDIAYQKAQRLDQLVNDLFEYVRTKNPKMSLQMRAINLKELLKQIAIQFQIQLTQEKMKSRLSLPESPVYVEADGDQLARVFENIISNAMNYGKEGGFVDIILEVRDQLAIVKIINYGDSIPLADLPYLFDRFYRIEKSRSVYTGGSGLGLAITKNIIELHKGYVNVESDDEETSFHICLPLS